jgi:S1-C subfamily serine protease
MTKLVFTVALALSLTISSTGRLGAADFSDLYASLKGSVVYIVSALPNGAASGTGFVYEATPTKAIIATANHVVEGAQAIDVIFDSDVSHRFHAVVKEHDHVHDIAFLEVDVANRKALTLAQKSQITEGESIAIIGYPRATAIFARLDGDDLRPTVHAGIVSAIRLSGEIVQIDAPTDHGDSGAPVVDTKTGAVIGLIKGELLDPSYAQRGLEQPLPGSAFAMSSPTIYGVRNGLIAAVPASSSISTSVSSVGRTTSRAVGAGQNSSASFRVGIVTLPRQQTNAVNEEVLEALTDRLNAALTSKNAFYGVPAPSGLLLRAGSQINATCDDLRLSAILEPDMRWNSTDRNAQMQIGLLVYDCYGVLYYREVATKSEGRSVFTNRTIDRELIDMGNDLIDHLLANLDAFNQNHAASWDNLMKNGIGLDSVANLSKSLSVTIFRTQGVFKVLHVRPQGLAANVGLRENDLIVTIDGKAPDAKLAAIEVRDALERAATVVVKRPNGNVTILMQVPSSAKTP